MSSGGYCSFDTETSILHTKVPVPLKGRANKGKFKLVRKLEIHEASWKDPRNDIYTIIFGTHPKAIKLLHKKKGFKRRLPYRVGQKLLKCHTMIGTNLKFDLGFIWKDKYFRKWLLKGGKIWDIQVAAYLLSGMRHQYPSMARLQKLILGIKTKVDKISYLYSKGIGADEIIYAGRNKRASYRVNLSYTFIGGIPVLTFDFRYRERAPCRRIWQAYELYGIEDGKTPMLIMQKQYKEAKEKGMLKVIELYNQYLLALTMMEVNGIPVDIPAVEGLYREFSLKVVEYLEKAESLVKHLWNDPRLPPLNINSTKHSSLLLFGGSIKCKVVRTTDVQIKSGKNKGKYKTKTVEEDVYIKGMGLPTNLSKESKKPGIYSTDKGVIETIYKKSKNDLAIEYCKNLKLSATYRQKISTYLNALLYRSIDGVIRANYNNTEVITSRLSASKPNLQNIPAHGDFGASIPALLIAPPGWVCVNVDYSQLETYCRALLTRDPTLINDLILGKDFHIQNMAWGWGITYEEGIQYCKVDKIPLWVERRSDAKAVTFGEAYGQMPASMSKRTGWAEDVIETIYKTMYENYPMLPVFDEKVSSTVQKSAIISRKSHFAERHAKNSQDAKGVPKRFLGEVELLPIRSRDKKSFSFSNDEVRHVGYYQSPTGKLYSFAEYGSTKKDGGVYRYYKPTQMKNYAMQGTAGDVQAITTVELFPFLLRNEDKVKLVNEIHDSKWFLIKCEHLDCILRKICGIMNNTSQLLRDRFGLDIPFEFTCEAKYGNNFADMQVYEFEDTKEAA